MKTVITISVDEEIKRDLQDRNKTPNASALINELLTNYYEAKNLTISIEQAQKEKEKEILEETKRKIESDEAMEKIKSFEWTPELQEEYRKGVKEGKWKGSIEFTKIKLGIVA